MSAKDQPTSGHGESEQVPDSIARLMGAQTFNITAHRFEDFHAAAQQAMGGNLTFSLGKPPGIARGVAILTNTDAQLRANLVIRRSGKTTKYARPTPEFGDPELAQFLEAIHLIPVVDVTNSEPTAYLMPFRITVWDGYRNLFNALARLDSPRQGLHLRYIRGGGNDPGHYDAEPFTMEEGHRKLWVGVPWPRPEDLLPLIPLVPFEELMGEDFNLRRAVQARRRRSLP